MEMQTVPTRYNGFKSWSGRCCMGVYRLTSVLMLCICLTIYTAGTLFWCAAGMHTWVALRGAKGAAERICVQLELVEHDSVCDATRYASF